MQQFEFPSFLRERRRPFADGAPEPSTLRQWFAVLRSRRFLSVVVGISLLFGATAALESGSWRTGLGRFFLVLAESGSIAAITALSVVFALRRAERGGIDRVLRHGLGGLMATPAAVAIVLALEGLLPAGGGNAATHWPLIALVAAKVAIIVVGASLIVGVVGADRPGGGAPAANPNPQMPLEEETQSAPRHAAFLERLPAGIGTELSHLTMRDHYLEVHTGAGQAMLLIRLSDAVAELADYDGFQIHRSHWVASGAVARLAREGRGLFVELSNGARLPVSRSFRQQVLDRAREKGFPPA